VCRKPVLPARISPGSMAVLLHGTSNKPRGRLDHGLVYGDHYFAEALLRLRRIESGTPSLPVAAVRASADELLDVPATLDDSLATRWSALGRGQWIEYYPGESTTVSKVSIAFYRGDERAARFRIETSADGQAWTRAASAISSGQGLGAETYDVPDGPARYVRIVGDGNTADAWNAITEVDIR
jgi:hypothetical protein